MQIHTCNYNLIIKNLTSLFFHFPKVREHRLHLWCKKRQRELSPEEELGTPEGVSVFAKWAPATVLFHRHYNGSDVLAREKMGVFKSKEGQSR